MEPQKYYTYAHYKPGYNVPFFIGKGKNRRAWDRTKRNRWWKYVVAKYGFEVKIIEENLTEEQAFSLEMYQIALWGRADQGKGPLVNLTDGGEGTSGAVSPMKGKIPWNKGIPRTEEEKAKMRGPKRNQEEWKDKIRKTSTGRKISEKTRRKLSKIRKGRKPTEETLKKMRKPHSKYKQRGPWSQEVKDKIGAAHKGHTRNRGRKLNKETKRKMSEAALLRWSKKREISIS